MQDHRGKIIVIKIGGAVMNSADLSRSFAGTSPSSSTRGSIPSSSTAGDRR